MGTQTLRSSTYQPAGTYIGEALGTASTVPNDVRVMCIVGKGSRYKHAVNDAIVRGFIPNEQLAFALAASGPYVDNYVATLSLPSNGKTVKATLVAEDTWGTSTTVLTDYWRFSTDFTQIIVEAAAFDSNSTYYFSYQSSSKAYGDSLVTDDLRKISAIGVGPNQNDYKRNVDFFLDTVLSEPVPAVDDNNAIIHQTHALAWTSDVALSNGAGAVVTLSNPMATYSRKYVLTATNTTGGFTWKSTPISAGLAAFPKSLTDNPLTLTLGGPAVEISENDVSFDVAIATGTVAIGDTYTFYVFGPSLFEVVSSLGNTNQFASAGPVVHAGTGTGTIAVDPKLFSGLQNVEFLLHVDAVTPTTVTFSYATGGDNITVSNTVAITDAASHSLALGVKIQLSTAAFVGAFVAGDTYKFLALAPRTFSTALDDRNTRFTVGTVGKTSDYGYMQIAYTSDTYEGGWGTVEANAASGYTFSLPGGLKIAARNVNAVASTVGLNESSHAVGDKWDVAFASNDRVFWNLDKRVDENLSSASLLLDRNGTVTGTAGTYYIVLKHDVSGYEGTISVVLNGTLLTNPTSWDLVGTDVITLPGVAAVSDVTSLVVSYTYAGSEPALGSTYYVSGDYLRPASDYNTPKLFYSRKTAQAFVAPFTVDNNLAIAIDLIYKQNFTPPALAVIMVRDSDDDGVFNTKDITAALEGAAGVGYIKDLVPVALPQFLDQFLSFNVAANDPFAKREQFLYYGAAAGTPVGDELTPGSLVFTSVKTMQVTGGTLAGAHGTRIMVSPTQGRVTAVLDDGTTVKPIVDGSFAAAALAAMVCGQPNNSTSMLKQKINGFAALQTYNDTVNRILGAANVIWFTDQGANVFQVEEDVTVDTYASHYHEILAMRMKQEATRYIRKNMDSSLIGYVPDTKSAGVSFITITLLKLLGNLVADGTIAPYQDADGNPRAVNSSDISVFVDDEDPELYHFTYTIYTRSTIKRLFGLYSVNENVFAAA